MTRLFTGTACGALLAAAWVPTAAVALPAGFDWMGESNQVDAVYGSSVACAGDVNGDGYDDIAVGAHGYDSPWGTGAAAVYYGSGSGPSVAPSWTAPGPIGFSAFGVSISSAGDVNADGYDDLIVGADKHQNPEFLEGYTSVFLGSATGLRPTPSWSVEGSDLGAAYSLGRSVSSAGDVNGDGYDDVLVGAHQSQDTLWEEGAAFVYLGSAAGLQATPTWATYGQQLNAHFGWSVSGAGDVNGDGYDDVIVGGHIYSLGEQYEGAAFVFLGTPSGVEPTPVWMAEGNQADAWFGYAVSGVGDVNGDGYDDVLVGALNYESGPGPTHVNEGGAFLYLGSPTGPAATPSWTGQGNQGAAGYGATLSGAGDVNGDGYDDVLVSAIAHNHTRDNEGAVYLYLGSAAGLSPAAAATVYGGQHNAVMGPVSSAGDTNADGFSDVLVSSAWYSHGQPVEGAAWVWLGRAGLP